MQPRRSPRPPRFRPAAALAALALTTTALGVLPGAEAAVDPIDGPQTSGDSLFPNVGNGGYDVSHYDLDIAWTPTGGTVTTPQPNPITALVGTIEGRAAIEATTTGAPLSSFSLDFEGPDLAVTSVTVDGTPAPFTRDEQPEIIRHKLIVTPAVPVEGEFDVVVEYAGTPNRHIDADGSYEGWNVTADGATFVNQPIGSMTGFPNNNTPADKATYDIAVDIPDTITNTAGTGAAAAASNGELVSQEPSGTGRTTWSWEQQEPMASELVLISIGKYDVLTTDVALADGRTIKDWSFVDSAIAPNTKTSINTQRARFKSVIDGLASIYGPYPGNSTGVVVDLVPSSINYALETQDRSFFPSSVSANTLVHEMAHQWYGNNVAPTDWNDLYINEGMATWAPTYFNSVLAEPPTSGSSTEYTYYQSWLSTAPESANWTIPPAGITDAADLYGYQTYTRSAQFWEALKLSIGDDDFFELIEEWQTSQAGESHGTADLQALAEQVSGRDLRDFFDDWVFDADKPKWPERFDFTLSDRVTSAPGGKAMVTYTLTAINKGFVPLTSSSVEITLGGDVYVDTTALPPELNETDISSFQWSIPATPRGGRSSVEITAELYGEPSGGYFSGSLQSVSLGGFCAPNTSCYLERVIPEEPVQGAPQPTLTGVAKVGRTLTVDPGTWDGDTDVQWIRNTRPITGADQATYTLTSADLGKDVSAVVSYTKPGYLGVNRIVTAEDVAAGVQTLRPVPRITGRARVGNLLTAVPGAHDAGTTVRYQWLADGDAIGGATGRTFRIPARYRGDYIRVRTVTSKPGYLTLTKTSAATAKVV